MTTAHNYFWAHECLTKPEPVDWIIEGLFASETLNCWVGAGGSKKTYSMIDQGVCIATGADWLHFPTRPTNVLFVDEECGPLRMRRRVYEVMAAYRLKEKIPFAISSMEGVNLVTTSGTQKLRATIKETKAGVVYIDALSDIMPGLDDSSAKDTNIIFSNLKKIVHDLHITINLTHHTNRSGDFRGSSNIRNQVDNMIEVESKTGSPNMEFTSTKGGKMRDIEEFDFAAVAHFNTDSFHLTSSTGKVKSDAFIVSQIKQGIFTLSEWQQNVPAPLPPSTIKPALTRLLVKGAVIRDNEGKQGTVAIYSLNGKH